MEITLDNYISRRIHVEGEGWKAMPESMQLSEGEREDLAQLLGGRHKTRALIKDKLMHLGAFKSFWLFSRLYKDNDGRGWQYCCGQEWNSEMAMLRKAILSN